MSDKKREMILNNLALSTGMTKDQLKNSKVFKDLVSKIEKKSNEKSYTLIIEDEQE